MGDHGELRVNKFKKCVLYSYAMGFEKSSTSGVAEADHSPPSSGQVYNTWRFLLPSLLFAFTHIPLMFNLRGS